MDIKDINTPEIYKESDDFRFFLKWFDHCLTPTQYDTENFYDLYDPLKCPDWLLWMLSDTMGYKYNSDLPTSYNRFVLLYFMSMIRNRGSKDGVTLAAEANLKQLDIDTVAGRGYRNVNGEFIPPKDILYNRLEDTSLPVNSVSVIPHVEEGYIDVIYFSHKLPVDACIEYVRPLGMYCLQHAGVKVDAKTKLSIDARLTNENDVGLSIGSTRVGHYSREDYSSLQKVALEDLTYGDNLLKVIDGDSQLWENDRQHRQPLTPLSHTRRNVWHRNSSYEGMAEGDKVQSKSRIINPGYRALYSLQLCNNEHIVQSLVPPNGDNVDDTDFGIDARIFGLGWKPQDITVEYPEEYEIPEEDLSISNDGKIRAYNLLYDKYIDEKYNTEVFTVEDDRSENNINPRPAVNPIMSKIGDAMSLNKDNTQYLLNNDTHNGIYNVEPDGKITTKITNKNDIKKD